jgi:hypothetical protein
MTNSLFFVTAAAVLALIFCNSSLRAETRNGAEYYITHRDDYADKRIVLFVCQTTTSPFGTPKNDTGFDLVYITTVDGSIYAHVDKNILISFQRKYHRDGGMYYTMTGNPLSCIFRVKDGSCYVDVDKI